MSPHAHGDQRTATAWCKMHTNYTCSLSHDHANQRTATAWYKMHTSYMCSLTHTKSACAREMRQTRCTLPIPWINMVHTMGSLHTCMLSNTTLMLSHDTKPQAIESAASLVATVRRRDGEGPWRRWRKRIAGVSTHVTRHTLGSATPPRGQHRELG